MAVHLIPPLDYSQILDIEAAEKNRSLRVKKGNWQHFAACPPPAKAPVAYGPRLPTADERLSGLNEEDLTLHDLAKVFRPSVANVEPTWQEPVEKGQGCIRRDSGKQGRLCFTRIHARVLGRALARARRSSQSRTEWASLL